MKKVLIAQIDPANPESNALELVGRFDKVTQARRYLRTEAAEGMYTILHVFEAGIKIGTEKVLVRKVTEGEKARVSQANR